jgi:hypothetical protein
MPLTLNQALRVNENVLIQDLGGESVLLNLDSEQYFGLDDIGTDMLSMLKESSSIQTTYDRLLQKYDVEPQQLQQDLLELIEQLVEHGLVQVAES